MKSIAGFILLLISTASFAQTEKGSFMLGGTLGFTSTNLSSTTNTSLNLSPNVSYFFLDRFAAGIVTPYSSGKTSDNGTIYGRSWTYSVGPTVRYYFLKGPLGFFPELSYTWGWSHSEALDPTTGITMIGANGNTTFLKAGGGMTYFLSKNVGVEGVLSYQQTHRNLEYSTPPGGPLIGGGESTITGLSFQIGLQVYLMPGKP